MIDDDNKTLWCGNLSDQVTEELLYELFLQAGPLEKVRIPRDRDGRQKSFAFITYCHEVSVSYALNLFRGTALFHRTLSLQCRGRMPISQPPIRSVSSDFLAQTNVAKQFAEMTDKLKEEDHRAIQMTRQWHDLNDKLVLDSLQGNWSHRHHPYRSKDNKNHINTDSYRNRESHSSNYRGNSHNKHSNNWRDRRNNHKKGNNYHRRD